MARHRMYQAGLEARAGDVVVVGGEEAHHAARVKRLEAGDPVEVLNGAGLVLGGAVEEIRKGPRGQGWEVAIRVAEAKLADRVKPRVEVWSAVPKGDRLEDMVDQLAQVGVAEWAPLSVSRSVVEPREGKMDRVQRRAVEASKQSGRAWAMEIGTGGGLAQALAGGKVVMADASGGVYRRTGAEVIRLLVGPEGGWTEEELSVARGAGVEVAVFGPHVLRLETAAVVGAGVVLAEERA